MKNVKTSGANLERKRGALFMMGVLFASSLVLTAFEWRSFSDSPRLAEVDFSEPVDLEEVMLASFPKEKMTPPPPKKQVVDVYAIVENDPLLNETLTLPDLEMPEEIVDIDPLVEVVDEPDVVWDAEVMPEFPGGLEGLYAYLSRSLRYPVMAKEAGISGKVFVEFIVDKSGKVREVTALNSIGGGCEEEAIRVIEAMPIWKPGEQRGRPVNVRYRIPVMFTMRR